MPLLGSHGVLPIRTFIHDSRGFWDAPSLFFLSASDGVLTGTCFIGLGLSLAVLFGVTNALVTTALWAIYLSFVHVGQIFYGYGWEMLLCEAGFLGIFFCPLRTLSPWKGAPSPILPYLVRWMLFRVMFGAGLIKIRGDECWRDLTCLAYHYETQPLPNPLSWYLHNMPMWFHKSGCLFNHFVELIVPWFYFAPRKIRHVAGLLTVVFQVILILSGNLSFLNWLTIVIAIPCFDDAALSFLRKAGTPQVSGEIPAPNPARRIVLTCVPALLICLSI